MTGHEPGPVNTLAQGGALKGKALGQGWSGIASMAACAETLLMTGGAHGGFGRGDGCMRSRKSWIVD